MMVIVMGAVLDWQRKKKGIEEQRVQEEASLRESGHV